MNAKLKSHYSRFEKRNFIFVYGLIALPVVQFIIFWAYVNASSIGLAFLGENGLSFNNIKQVFDAFSGIDPYGLNLGKSIKNSLVIWTTSTLIVFPISILTTYILQRRILGHYVWRVCFIIPGLLGAVVWVALVRYMVGHDGFIVAALIEMGVELPEQVLYGGLLAHESTALPSIIIINSVMGIAGNNVVLTGAFSRVPDELYESASLDGAGFWTECFAIAIPCVWSTITMLLTFKLCGLFTADMNVFLYSNGTGNPGMNTVGFHLYFMQYRISLFGGDDLMYAYPSAVGFVLTMMTMPVVLFGKWGLEKLQDAVEL